MRMRIDGIEVVKEGDVSDIEVAFERIYGKADVQEVDETP